MQKRLRTIKAGELVVITSGEYSAYQIHCVGRALKDAPLEEIIEEWLEAHPDQRPDYQFNESEFIAHLFSAGFIEEVSYVDFYLGGYNKVSGAAVGDVLQANAQMEHDRIRDFQCPRCGVAAEVRDAQDSRYRIDYLKVHQFIVRDDRSRMATMGEPVRISVDFFIDFPILHWDKRFA